LVIPIQVILIFITIQTLFFPETSLSPCKANSKSGDYYYYYYFNEGAGTLVVDSSGQRNHGTIEGTIARHLSTRMDKGQRAPNALERRAEDVSGAFRTWESAFQLTHGRSPTKSDILLTGNPVAALARQLGLFN